VHVYQFLQLAQLKRNDIERKEHCIIGLFRLLQGEEPFFKKCNVTAQVYVRALLFFWESCSQCIAAFLLFFESVHSVTGLTTIGRLCLGWCIWCKTAEAACCGLAKKEKSLAGHFFYLGWREKRQSLNVLRNEPLQRKALESYINVYACISREYLFYKSKMRVIRMVTMSETNIF